MKLRTNNSVEKIIVIALTISLLLVFYSKVLFHPNNFFFSMQADALKNYFTYAYQVKHDFKVNFMGMNYPYGELFLYTDSHPLLSYILHLLAQVFPSIANCSVGIINFMMVFSYVFCAYFLFLILRRYQVKKWIAVTGAAGIAMLSPQIFRMASHFALAYNFFIPLTWYLLLRFFDSRKKIKWSVIIMINSLVWLFTHAYLGVILTAFLALMLIFDFLLNLKTRPGQYTSYLSFIIQVIIPLAFFWSFANLLDTHTARPVTHHGFFIYTSAPSGIFIPFYPPLKPLLNNYVYKFESPSWEGIAYIGFTSIIMILVYLILLLSRLFKRHVSVNLKPDRTLILALLSGIIILLVSMGYPFKLSPELLIDPFPVLKLFRAIGRFSWVFYYVITIFSVWLVGMLVDHFMKKDRRVPAIAMGIFLIGFYYAEAIPYHWKNAGGLTRAPNFFSYELLDESHREALGKISPDNYQAILPLPFYNLGATFWKPGTTDIYRESQTLSYHTGIPICGNHLPRTGIIEAKNLMQALSPPYYEKALEKDIPVEKPLLIVHTFEPLSKYEEWILGQSEPLFVDDSIGLYMLDTRKLFESNADGMINDFEQRKNDLFRKDGFYVSDTNGYILYEDFEDSPSDIARRGSGAFRDMKREYNVIMELPENLFSEGKTYIASFWVYNCGENHGEGKVSTMAFLDESYNEWHYWHDVTDMGTSEVIDGCWSLIELKFSFIKPGSKMALVLHSNHHFGQGIIIDDLLIRPEGMEVYRIDCEKDGKVRELFWNGHWVVGGKREI